MTCVSVVMPVYNGERYLRQALESILKQTFTDFEFVIIEDGSTDNTCAILESYDDSRIVIVRNQKNIGFTRSLNKGLSLAQGEYVARMDADDISLPQRFTKQVAFLREHPEIGILGCNCLDIDSKGRYAGLRVMPDSNLQIRWASLLENPFAHPAVMMRRDVITRNGLAYDESFETTQDYELWSRVLKYTRGGNLSEPLVQYRLCLGVTTRHRKAQLKNHDAIALRTIREQLPGFVINPEEVSQLRRLFVAGDEFTLGASEGRVASANSYLDMFEAFTSHHPKGLHWRTLQRQIAAKVASIVLHHPVEPGWIGIFRRLAIMEPASVLSLLRILAGVTMRRLGESAQFQ